MCTAITLKTKDSYFGRNLDLEYSYNETVTITPRNYKFDFKKVGECTSHFAMIGMAYVKDNYPLYYDATNEKGLSMAGLNFPYNAFYHTEKKGRKNISPYEFIPYVLCQCTKIDDVKELLENINLVNINFSDELPLSPLHWIIADKDSSIVVESVREGLKVYDNPIGVLTNNPPFDLQIQNLEYLESLSGDEPTDLSAMNEFYTRGTGAVGLPGDWSSQSRFIKAAFVKSNSISDSEENESVSQFFHILSSVEMPRGCLRIAAKNDITIYSSCCNTDKTIYYYKTYDNSQINGVDMRKENLDGDSLISYLLVSKSKINIQN